MRELKYKFIVISHTSEFPVILVNTYIPKPNIKRSLDRKHADIGLN